MPRRLPPTVLLAAALLSAATTAEAGIVEMRYSGTLEARRSTLKAPRKTFTLYCLLDRQAATCDYVLEEQGPGRWAWPERFGQVRLDRPATVTGTTEIRVLYLHQGTLYPLRVPRPVFEDIDKLKPGASWTRDRVKYTVAGAQSKQDRPCWRVELSNNFGPRGAIWVEKATGLVVASRRRLTMGQGDEFVLSTELASSNPVPEKRLATLRKPVATLLELQRTLKRKPDQTRPELGNDQVAATRKIIGRLQKESRATPFAALVAFIDRDIKNQSKRASSVEELAEKFLGKPAPPFRLTTIDRKTIDSKSLKGKIVVLHFWSYRGERLVEPYGQVGYLDFLHGKRRRLGVQVIGVAVNKSLGNPQTARAALRSVRKLREFMNLDYPIGTDAGKVLESFGDPRSLDVSLPLWVVIDADGKVAMYKVGFYRIKADEGLKQLDNTLIPLIRAARKKAPKKTTRK